jgi:hypothetical protein
VQRANAATTNDLDRDCETRETRETRREGSAARDLANARDATTDAWRAIERRDDVG